MKYEQLATDILDHVGGKENVTSVVHCMTRLRFKLKDEDIAKFEELKAMDGVVTVIKAGGQFQVVIGNHVPEVYKAVTTVGGFAAAEGLDINEDGGKDSLLSIISGIFIPILGYMAASGMIKGFLAITTQFKWLEVTSGSYKVLFATGDALFNFLPIVLGYTAAKKFKANPVMGIVVGAALMYPGMIGTGDPLYTLFEGSILASPIHMTFFGIPVIIPAFVGYASTVVPILVATYFGAKVEKFMKKVTPDVLKMFLVPMVTLLVIVPGTYLIIGPISVFASKGLGELVLSIYKLSPIISGIFIGGTWQVLVMFGLHWAIIPIYFNNMATLGYDPIIGAMVGASFAQIGAVLAVTLRTKDVKMKSLGSSAFVTGIFGITEPAIYGVTLPLVKPFVFSCIGAAVGGGIVGLFGTMTYVQGGLGIFSFPSYVNPDGTPESLIGAVLASVVGFAIGFVLTFLFGMPKEEKIKA